MDICGIYKIANKETQQVYIGQSTDIAQRWKDHLKSLDDVEIHQGLRNNILSFTFEVIEVCSKDQLDEREQYWVKYYDALNSGYNMTLGGKTFIPPKNRRPVRQYDLNGNYINSYSSIKEAKEQTGISHIDACCRGERKTSGGFQWIYSDVPNEEIQIKTNLVAHTERAVIQYDLNGQKIQEFKSIAAAAKFTNIAHTSILKVCQKKGHTAGGFRWSYSEEPLEIRKSIGGTKKKILQISKENNEIIQTFNSLTEAAKSLGNKSAGCIGEVCNGKRKSAYGYIWKYLNEENFKE